MIGRPEPAPDAIMVWNVRHALAAAAIAITVAALQAFRLIWFEPRAIGIACLHHAAPVMLCAVRNMVALAIHDAVWGTLALVLGIAALISFRLPVAVAAICAGIAGLTFYNVSWGMLGVALGAWTWLAAPLPSPR